MKVSEDDLVRQNLGMVHALVKKFHPQNTQQREDLISIGMEKLLKAIRGYNKNSGSFSTYAYIAIWRGMSRHITQETQRNNKYESRDVHKLGRLKEDDWTYCLPKLTKLENRIINLKYDGYTLKHIYKVLDMSQYQFKRIYTKILRKIQRANNIKVT